MTVAVSPAIATTIVPPNGRAAREAETSQGGFDEALDNAGSRTSPRTEPREAERDVTRWRRHETLDDTPASRGGDPSVSKPAALGEKSEAIGAAVDDDPSPAAEATEPEDCEVEDMAAEDGEEDRNLPVQIRAQQTISAMMGTAPLKPRGWSETETGRRILDGPTERFGLTPSGKANGLVVEKRAATPETSESETPKAGAAMANALSVGDDVRETHGPQTQDIAKQHKVVTGAEDRIARETSRTAKLSDASGGSQDARMASGEPAATASHKPAADAEGRAGSDTGQRDQRGAAPGTRRIEPQSGSAKVSVISQQAAPAPVAAPALGASAAAVVAAIDAHQGLRPALNSSLPALAGTQPMHSLKIQLHPAELGLVTANLKASGEQLSVELRVESDEAYQRLSADSEAILKSLRTLGYDIDRISIIQPQIASSGIMRSDASAGSSPFSRDGASFPSGESDSSGDRLGGGQTGGRGDRGDAQHGGESRQAYRARAGGGLYI